MHRIARLLVLLPLLIAAGVSGRAVSVLPVAAEETAAIRIAVADTETGAVTILDGDTGMSLATFSMPGATAVHASSTGRWFYAVHTNANKVTVIDSGLRLTDHGDHQDIVIGAPFVRGAVNTGRRLIDTWVQNGLMTVHSDDDATLAVFDDRRLEFALDYTEIRGAGAGHNNAVVLGGDTVLLSLASAGQITAYGMDNGVLARFDGCPGTHGWTTRNLMAGAGCADGVMLITKDGANLTAKKLAEPAGAGETDRVSTLRSHPDSPVLIGNFGQGLAIIDPTQDSFRSVSLPANPVSFYFTHDGSGLVVLTADGMVRLLNPATGQVLGSVAAVAPVRTGMPAPPAPRMIVGEGSAYATDPTTGEVVEVDLAKMVVGRKMRVGGAPSNIAVIVMEGEAH